MENSLPVSNPPTVDDALRALQRHAGDGPSTDELEVVFGFLNRLAKMAEPERVLASDEEGHVLDGACQWGFEHIDDNADLFVVHANDLVKYVMANRRVNKAANALKKLVTALEEMGINDPYQAVNGCDMVDVMCKFYPQLKAALA